MLGVGWYAGPIGAIAPRGRELYGPFASCLVRLEIETDDGKQRSSATDSWQSSIEGPIRFAEIYDGRDLRRRREMPGWNLPGYAAADWQPCRRGAARRHASRRPA